MDLDYSATSTRPQWSELPEAVRVAVRDALDVDVVSAGPSARSGFTRGFAAPLVLADGRRVFVKAASERFRFAYTGYQREAVVVPQLPTSVPVPRIITTTHTVASTSPASSGFPGSSGVPASSSSLASSGVSEERWFAVVTEFVDGRMPGNPWTAEDFAIATATCEATAEAMTPSPLDGLHPMTENFDELSEDGFVRWFADMRDGDRPIPDGFQPWLPDRLSELADLASRYPDALTGETATHGDLRADNMLVDPHGTLWTVDWNWLSLGPVWFDWIGLLPAARHHGIDTDTYLARSPLTADTDPGDIDCYAVVLAAYMLSRFDQPIPPGGPMPAVRRHQRLTAWQHLNWLAHRHHW